MVVINRSLKPSSNVGGAAWDVSGLNPDLAWAKSVYENTNLEGYPYKTLELSFAYGRSSKFNIPVGIKLMTSDGQLYENNETSQISIEHIWNDENAKETTYYIGKKLRWIICFYDSFETSNDLMLTDAIYFVSNMGLPFNGRANYWQVMRTFDFEGEGGFRFTSSSTTFNYAKCLERVPAFRKLDNLLYHLSYSGCEALKYIAIGYGTSRITSCSGMFDSCSSLVENPYFNTDGANTFSKMFRYNYGLLNYNSLNSENVTNFAEMFSNCKLIKEIDMCNTSNGNDFSYVFNACEQLDTVKNLNLINATNVSSAFWNCYKLTNLDIKNIKISLQIGSGSKYGHLLTLESLLQAIKELWDNSAGSSALTLTIGSANLSKLANMYVKLIDITDEMRAEDEYIDNKKPFVVCESTEDGAMLITEYVTSKNWQLA
jgi:hypothetical protein